MACWLPNSDQVNSSSAKVQKSNRVRQFAFTQNYHYERLISISFSFGNGFQGTDIVANNLYVMVYYSQSPAEALNGGVKDELANYPQVRSRLLSEAARISSAATVQDLQIARNLFDADVNPQLGTKLTSAGAEYLTALAQATGDDLGLRHHAGGCY